MYKKRNDKRAASVRAPYNFVPYSSLGPLRRYETPQDLPRQDCIHEFLHTGEIHVTMTAKTPVCVSDAEHFFKDGAGNYAIPGSTIRGMTRQNVQILGLGLMRPGEDFENQRLFYRVVASAKTDLSKELSQYYKSVLKVNKGEDDRNPLPHNIKAGYLAKDGRGCYIIPAKGNKFIRVPRNKLKMPYKECSTIPVVYQLAGNKVDDIRPSDVPVDGMMQGTVLFTGRPIKNENSAYLFPRPDRDAPRVDISEEDRLAYEQDWKARKNGLRNDRFWELPREGEEKPVFYTHIQGHTYFGMTLFLRIGYPNDFLHGLPQNHRDVLQEGTFLDYPRSIFGFSDGLHSYRSRVSFGDFTALGEPVQMKPISVVLGNPKPSYYPGYVENGLHYGRDHFLLRGYKQYWLKEWNIPPYTGKSNVATTLYPLKEGTRFRGVIRFRNLHTDELGLLLWALRLENGCYQTIGMGKPYGMGRMDLKIDCLKEFSQETLYRDLCDTAEEKDIDTIESYIRSYDAYVLEQLLPSNEKTSLKNFGFIRDFFYIHSKIMPQSSVSYMALGDYKGVKTPLPTIRDFRTSERVVKEEVKSEKSYSLDDAKAMLLKKYENKN